MSSTGACQNSGDGGVEDPFAGGRGRLGPRRHPIRALGPALQIHVSTLNTKFGGGDRLRQPGGDLAGYLAFRHRDDVTQRRSTVATTLVPRLGRLD